MLKKNILYIAPALPVGGAEKFLVLLSNSLIRETHTQTVISLSTNNKLQNEFEQHIRFLALPRLKKFDLNPARDLRRIVLAEKPDIIFCLNFFSYFFMRLAIVGLRLKSKVIISYHSTIHSSKKDDILHKFLSLLLNKNDSIITVSENQARYTSRKYHIPEKYFKTIHNGIDIGRWQLPDNDGIRSRLRKQYEIPLNAPVIIMTAAFRPEKNHSGALKALKELHSNHNCKAYLLLVGEGILFEQTRKQAIELNMLEFVKFSGPQIDVRPFYWASNLFTLCSTSVETFSIAALEAMACGLPAVLTNIGGASEMVVDGLNGFLCIPTESDIALKWSKGLNTDFSPQAIHDYINKNYSAVKMTEEYKLALGIHSN